MYICLKLDSKHFRYWFNRNNINNNCEKTHLMPRMKIKENNGTSSLK